MVGDAQSPLLVGVQVGVCKTCSAPVLLVRGRFEEAIQLCDRVLGTGPNIKDLNIAMCVTNAICKTPWQGNMERKETQPV